MVYFTQLEIEVKEALIEYLDLNIVILEVLIFITNSLYVHLNFLHLECLTLLIY